MSKIMDLISSLQTEFAERQEVIEGLIIGLLTGSNVLLIGPPGTAKTMLVNRLVHRISDIQHFSYLMTRFTRPDEIIGPVSLKGLEKDEFTRVLTGRMADVHVAFLDEIFNSNSACLNSILNIMNEKQILNGTEVYDVPLVMLVGATNELPVEISGELRAFYDRFLLKYQINYLQQEKELEQIITGSMRGDLPLITAEELFLWQKEIEKIEVPQKLVSRLAAVVIEMRKSGIMISDRRARQSINLLKGKAFIKGKAYVDLDDMDILRDAFWLTPEDREVFLEVVYKFKQPIAQRVVDISQEALKLYQQIEEEEVPLGTRTEVGAGLIKLQEELKKILDDHRGDEETAYKIKDTINSLDQMISGIFNNMLAVGGGVNRDGP